MARVIAGMTMSLGGFVSDRNGDLSRLYPDMEAIRATGAVVMGRRSYDMGNVDFTGYEFQTPIFVLTHRAPEEVAKGQSNRLTFTFIEDGIESVIAQAKAAAGDRDVTVGDDASTIQQCLAAGVGGRAAHRPARCAALRRTPAVRSGGRRAGRAGNDPGDRISRRHAPAVSGRALSAALHLFDRAREQTSERLSGLRLRSSCSVCVGSRPGAT